MSEPQAAAQDMADHAAHEERWRWAAALLVVLLVGAVVRPFGSTRVSFSPDAVEHLGIAWNWINGAGWTDPVKWNFYLSEPAPLPGFAVRAPMISAVLALPLAMGAELWAAHAFHALIACAISGLVVLVAARITHLPAAIAAGILFGLSPAYRMASVRPLTEALAVGALCLIFLTARGVLRSIPAALLCSAATILAWMTRPNLLAAAFAVLVAGILELGPRRAVRTPALYAYLAGIALLYLGIGAWVSWQTGLEPYQGYGATAELFGARQGREYQKEYIGALNFIGANADRVMTRSLRFMSMLMHMLFVDHFYHFAGWLFIPAAGYAFFRRGRGNFEYRLLIFCALGFSIMVGMYYAAFDRLRYPIPAALCMTLSGMVAMGDAVTALSRSVAARFIPLLVACLLSVVCGVMLEWRVSALENAAVQRPVGALVGSTRVQELCPLLEPGRVVAARMPWDLSLNCGSPAVVLPPDMRGPALQKRFFAEQHVAYVVLRTPDEKARLKHSGMLRLLGSSGQHELYAVVPAATLPATATAPPMVCAGIPDRCAEISPRFTRPNATPAR